MWVFYVAPLRGENGCQAGGTHPRRDSFGDKGITSDRARAHEEMHRRTTEPQRILCSSAASILVARSELLLLLIFFMAQAKTSP